MGTLFRKIIWIIISAAIIYAGYKIYTDWWNGELPQVGRVKEYAQNVLRMGSEGTLENTVKQKAGEYIQTVTEEAKESSVEYVKEKAKGTFTTIGEEIIEKVKDFFGISSSSTSGLPSGEVIPEPTGPGFSVPPPQATISYGIGEQFTISINSGASYAVDWGSGTSESGKTAKTGLTILKHSWDQEGDYTVKVSVDEDGRTSNYEFPVRVYK